MDRVTKNAVASKNLNGANSSLTYNNCYHDVLSGKLPQSFPD